MKLWILVLAVCLVLLGTARSLHANSERHEGIRVAEDDSGEQTASQEPPEAPPPAPEDDPPPPPTED